VPDTDNGRATLARVISELASQDRRADERHADLKSEFVEVRSCIIDITRRMRDVEREQVRNEEQHKSMRRDGTILSSIQSISALLGGIFIKG